MQSSLLVVQEWEKGGWAEAYLFPTLFGCLSAPFVAGLPCVFWRAHDFSSRSPRAFHNHSSHEKQQSLLSAHLVEQMIQTT